MLPWAVSLNPGLICFRAQIEIILHSVRHTHAHPQSKTQNGMLIDSHAEALVHTRVRAQSPTHSTRTHTHSKAHTKVCLMCTASTWQSGATSARHRDKHFTHSGTQQRGEREVGEEGGKGYESVGGRKGARRASREGGKREGRLTN